MVLVVAPDGAEAVLKALRDAGETGVNIGDLQAGSGPPEVTLTGQLDVAS